VQRGQDIDGEAADDQSGLSLSLSSDGQSVAIGAPYNGGSGTNAGHVRIYDWDGNAWVKRGEDIDGEEAGDESGQSVALSSDGQTVAIGARLNDGAANDAGHARVYAWNGSAWLQRGADIDGEAAGDQSGYSVALSGDGQFIAVGALFNDGSANDAGHVRVYAWSGSAWVQRGADIDGEAAGDLSGYAVSLSSDGQTIAIGARFNDGSDSNAGHVRVYAWSGSGWVQRGADIDGEGAFDRLGEAVALSSDGQTIAIGATRNDGAFTDAGHVRIFRWDGSAWAQRAVDIDGRAEGDWSGHAVALSSDGETVAIGTPFHSSGGTNAAGDVRVFAVFDVPWAPSIDSVVAGDGEATVAFTPSFVGASSVTSYTVTSIPGANTVTCAASPCTVTNLTNGQSYGFTVAATNVEGTGAASAVSDVVTPQWIAQVGGDIDGEAANDTSSSSIAVSSDGQTIAIGAPFNNDAGTVAGHVRVYRWSGTAWVQRGADIDGEVGSQSGSSVSLSSDGQTVAIGAPSSDAIGTNAGQVRVYAWSGSAWAQRGADIDGEAAEDLAGSAVSLSSDGQTVAIGASENGALVGQVRVYAWNGSAWVKRGSDIDGEAQGDISGHSVALSADGLTVAIGAPLNDGSGNFAGHVRVFTWNGSAWLQRGADIDGEAAGDQSGWSVSLSSDGQTVAIGARFNDGSGSNAGHVRVYAWSGSGWMQRGADIEGEASEDQAGYAVSLSSDGQTVAVGAPDDGFRDTAGYVRLYSWNGSVWVPQGAGIVGEALKDRSGFALALSSDGRTVAVGAPRNDGGAGHVRVYQVVGIPGVPTIDRVISGDGEATIFFFPPFVGAPSVTSYTVTSIPDGVTATCSASPCRVTGLTNGQAYRFTVSATNPVGTGAASAATSLFTPEESNSGLPVWLLYEASKASI
jgi:hypothetical protein